MSSRAGDPYLDPASGVLRNLLGITHAAELGRAEAALSASRLIDLERRRQPGGYDLAHLQAFHRYILGDVYAWAGQLRTVSIAKGSVFCLPQHLESYAADVMPSRLRSTPLAGSRYGSPAARLTCGNGKGPAPAAHRSTAARPPPRRTAPGPPRWVSAPRLAPTPAPPLRGLLQRLVLFYRHIPGDTRSA